MKHSTALFSTLLATLLVAGCTQEPDKQAVRQIEDPPPPPYDPPYQPHHPSMVGDRVFFDFDKAVLRPDAIETINRQAEWLKTQPALAAMVEGHADERGTREYNIALGCRRAAVMREALILRGIAAERLGTISYGKERPSVLGSNENGWAQNRRGVLVIRGEGSGSTPQPLNCGEG